MNRLDTLHVRHYRKQSSLKGGDQTGDRVVIDFDEEQTTDRFLILASEGGTICVGHERVWLDWAALIQLADLIKNGAKTLRAPKTPTPLG